MPHLQTSIPNAHSTQTHNCYKKAAWKYSSKLAQYYEFWNNMDTYLGMIENIIITLSGFYFWRLEMELPKMENWYMHCYQSELIHIEGDNFLISDIKHLPWKQDPIYYWGIQYSSPNISDCLTIDNSTRICFSPTE